MKNWRYKLAEWIQGRYGIDPMYKGLLGIYLAIVVLNLFIGSRLLSVLGIAVLVFAMYRFISKNTARRAEENRIYISLRDRIKKKVMLVFNRVKYFKTHRYRECPSCHTMLRLKKQVGTITVNCPKCHTTFQATIKH